MRFFALLVLLPWLMVAPDQCGMNRDAMVFVDAWLQELGRRGKIVYCDERLVRAAQKHAEYLVSRDADDQDESLHLGRGGSSPNERVRAEGYELPDYYPEEGNQIESALNRVGAQVDGVGGLRSLLASPPHRAHLMGEEWFRTHVAYGIGMEGSVLVVVIAPEKETHIHLVLPSLQ